MPEKIAVLGLGIMGSAMAKNLKKAGHDVYVYNRTRQKALALAEHGIKTLETPAQASDLCGITIVMVTDPAAVESVCFGPSGWTSGNPKGRLLINMSTVGTDYAIKLAGKIAAAGARFLDCPVCGSKAQAENAQLVILAAGDKSEADKARSVLLAMGKAVVYSGQTGRASSLKLCINLLLAQMTTGLAEAVSLAEATGVEPALVSEVIHNSPAMDCGYFRIKEKNILSRSYAPAFSLANMLKDVRFAQAEAAAKGRALPVNAAVRQLMEDTLARGFADKDLSSVFDTLEKGGGK